MPSNEEEVPIVPRTKQKTTAKTETPEPQASVATASRKSTAVNHARNDNPPPVRKLEPAELTRREEAKRNIAMRDQTPLPVEKTIHCELQPATTPGGVDAIVMMSNNPHLRIFSEYRAGQLSLSEMIEGVDADICADEKKMRLFDFVQPPQKPQELIEAEKEVWDKSHPDQLKENLQLLHKKLAALKPKVASYLRTAEKIAAENKSNHWWLNEMLTRQRGRNRTYEQRILEALSTHTV